MRDIIVPVSGGKDSQACVALAVERFGADRVEMLHQHTGFDHELTYEHLLYMQDRYGVPLTNCKSTKYSTVPEVMFGERVIPTRWARACTKQLKLIPQYQWLAAHPERSKLLLWLGMRAAESQHRKKNYGHLSPTDRYRLSDLNSDCPKRSDADVELPIVDKSTGWVYDFLLRKRKDKINPLYSKGHNRVGCYPCVLAGKKDFAIAARDPTGRKHIEQVQQAIIFVKSLHPDKNLDSLFEHDLEQVLKGEPDPLGLYEIDDKEAGGCSWCAM